MTASLMRASILDLLLYSGSSSVLKHVWLVGSLLLSGPSRWMTHLSAPRPPMGALKQQQQQGNGTRASRCGS